MNLPFDILGAARAAYRFLIDERHYLLRLAVVPALIKLICYVTALALGYEDNLLRMAVILLPASLVEGWMLAHMVRLIMTGQRWPFQPSGDMEADMTALRRRMHGVMGGLVSYGLVNLVLAGIFALMTGLMPAGDPETAAAAMDPVNALLGITLSVMCLWAFPLLWIFIPLSVSADWRAWTKDVLGWRFSLPMIGVWMICYLPIAAIMLLGISAIMSPFTEGDVPTGARFAVIILSVILDTVKALIGTAGITFALADYYQRAGKAR